MCLWFVDSVSCLNVSCVSGLSIMCLVSILPVSLACPICVLSQYCRCLWFIHYLCLVSILMCLWFVHYVSCPNNACFSGLSIMCLVSILRVYLFFSFCVLSQYSLCLWFDHSVSCPNNACVSGLSFPCPVSVMHVYGLSILCVLSQCCLCLVCQFTVLSQYCICFWFVQSLYCLKTARIFGLHTMFLSQ